MRKVGENKFRVIIWIVLPVLILSTIFLSLQVFNTKFDFDFEKFYPVDDPDTRFFEEFREEFHSDNDFLLIAIPTKGSVFDSTFLRKIDSFTKDVEKLELVQFVLSITNQSEVFIYPNVNVQKPYIDFNDLDPVRDSIRIYKNHELINSLVSDKGGAIGLYIRHEDYLSKKKSDELIVKLLAVSKKYHFDNIKISGRTIGQKYYIDEMSFEVLFFMSLSAVLTIIFLVVAFRSAWGVIIPFIVIACGLIWLIGGMAIFKEPMNIILTTLPSIMFIVSMSDTIHLVSRYMDALRSESTVFGAIGLAIKEVGLATFLTSVTTAVGFFTLVFVKVQPIQVFGIVMGIGVLLAFVLTFTLLPMLFYLFPGPKYVRKENKDHFWKKYLQKWFILTIRNPRMILLMSGIVIIISAIGMTQMNANNYLLDDLHPKEQLKQDFNYMDTTFGGVRSFTLVVTLKDTSQSIWDKEILEEIDTVQQYLENDFGVQVRSSLISALKVMNRGSHSGLEDYYKLPESQRKLRSYRRNLRIAGEGEFIRTMLDSTEHVLVISGTIPDISKDSVDIRKDKFNHFLNERHGNEKLDFRITGSAFLIDKNMSYLAQSMVKGLLLSVLIVALIMGLIYKSVRVLVISLIPNFVPLIVIAGVMGYFSIDLKTSTAIIFTISFGIAVDDTIHFLGKFKYELLKGKGKMYALKRTYLTTGKAMVLTTLILCSGFLLLILSSFMGTFYLGVLLCITLFVALLADLTLLPVLLMLFYKEKKK